jgi:hypothetical protein
LILLEEMFVFKFASEMDGSELMEQKEVEGGKML